MNFNDPTGYCGADPGHQIAIWDPEQLDFFYVWNSVEAAQAFVGCESIRDELEELYGISITGEWTREEMGILR